MMRVYHGTSAANAQSIMENGFDVNAPRTRDPGDFGFGMYFTTDRERAERHGEAVLEAVVDLAMIETIQTAYFGGIAFTDCVVDGEISCEPCGTKYEPEDQFEKMFHALAFTDDGTMKTCAGGLSIEDKTNASKMIQRVCLAMGVFGIWSIDESEIVVFTSSAIMGKPKLVTNAA